ncbi:putative periplasmic protein kinase ArgK [Enhygromyxa salina]|uniref:Putative periplasmic protein kinase ArgK n=1 Tax=Enhygromyxa salina TaxID=215803 RepID=A0A0C2CNB9_9BACT|nr:putative periplasmic protein kinase ArgK [Enhygromyxa salina]
MFVYPDRGDAIRVCGEQRQSQRSLALLGGCGGLARTFDPRGRACPSEHGPQLLGRALDRRARAGVAKIAAMSPTPAAFEQLDLIEDVRVTRARRAGPPQRSLGQQRRGRGRQVADPMLDPGDQQSREPGVQREVQHRATEPGQPAVFIDRPERAQQLARDRQRGWARGFEPFEAVRRVDARGRELEHRTREIEAAQLGQLMLGAMIVVVLAIQPNADACPGPARATRPLGRRGPGDRAQTHAWQAAARIKVGDARLAAVDYRDHTVDRDRGLGHVGAEDQLARVAGCDRVILLRARQLTMQRQQLEPRPLGQRRTLARAGLSLARARQEHQRVTRLGASPMFTRLFAGCSRWCVGSLRWLGPPDQPALDQIPHRSSHAALERLLAVAGARAAVLDLDREAAAVRPQACSVQEFGDGLGVERGRHRQQAQRRAKLLLAAQQREQQIRVEMTLVELVEDHRVDARELRIITQPPHQHALGHEPQPGLGVAGMIEADPIPNPSTNRFPEQRRGAQGRQSRGQAARLQHEDLSGPKHAALEQHRRDHRGLARARRRLDHDVAPWHELE